MKKNILITGAAGNLGKAVVDTLKQKGYTIIGTVSPGKRSSIDDADVKVLEVDLTKESAVADLISNVIKEHKTIDGVILLAGGYKFGGIADATTDVVKQMISLNFETAYNVARPAFQQMLKQSSGGRIILVGARPALEPQAGKQSFAYALSKSLSFNLANLLNAEGADKNVVTSVIVPSIIDTPVNRKDMPNADFSKWVKPEAIAENILHLLSDEGDVLREPVLKIYGKA